MRCGADEIEERAAMVALASLPEWGPATLLTCLHEVGAARAWAIVHRGRASEIDRLVATIVEAEGSDRRARRLAAPEVLERARSVDAEDLLVRHEAAGRSVVVHDRPGYPARLLADPAPPAVLFVDGPLDALLLRLAEPTVALVGTRNATRVGRDLAASLAVGLAERGVSVVSGLALGIDGAAHHAITGLLAEVGPRPALGRPIGVVAAGLDITYPRRHRALHQQVVAHGAIVTEVPLGGEPLPWRFPARNRIIAGLSDAVVVVESRSTGGSMLTAAEGLRRDVPVLAVPGHPTMPSAAGTLDLICDGATPVRDLDDVLVAIGLGGARPSEGRGAGDPERGPAVDLGPTAAAVCEVLETKAATLADLVFATGLDLGEISTALVDLEAAGSVVRSGSWFERTGSSAPNGGRR